MSTPVTTPVFQVREGHLYVVRRAASVSVVSGTAATIIGQAASIRHQSNSPTRKIPRLGDTAKKTSYAPVEFSVNLEIYSEGDAAQMAVLLNGTLKTGTAWAGTEKLILNPSVAAYNLYIDQYATNTGTSDVREGTWEMKTFKASSLQVGIQPDGAATIQMSGECDEIAYYPTALATAS